MKVSNREAAIANLVTVATSRTEGSGGEPWDYGWSIPNYRRSSNAAASGPHPGALIRLDTAGVAALEQAVEVLRKIPSVKNGWNEDELWGVVVTAATQLPLNLQTTELQTLIADRIDAILAAGPTFVGFLLANVTWESGPVKVGNGVIGRLDKRWLALAQRTLDDAVHPEGRFLERWGDGVDGKLPVAYGAWIPANGMKAQDAAELRFNELVALSLLLDDPIARKLWSGRGDSHRPGVLGLVIDRAALESVDDPSIETIAEFRYSGPQGAGASRAFWGTSAFPLDQLLMPAGRIALMDEILTNDTHVHLRLRTAATWYAKAHWSKEDEDRVLALGIALDALVGDRSGLPGRVLADRFALLETDKSLRAERAKRFGELYAARSAIAHGGKSSAIEEKDFVRDMELDVRWLCSRVIASTRLPSSMTEGGYRELFEQLKWGT